jgi:hypothetical protein
MSVDQSGHRLADWSAILLVEVLVVLLESAMATEMVQRLDTRRVRRSAGWTGDESECGMVQEMAGSLGLVTRSGDMSYRKALPPASTAIPAGVSRLQPGIESRWYAHQLTPLPFAQN